MEINLLTILILFFTGLWAGAVNSVAGGGTFFSFPILLLLGMPPILANTTNKFALWFASIAGVTGFWKEIKEQKERLAFYFICGLIGSLIGSLVLLATPAETFEAMIPWLMLAATCLFAFGKRVVKKLRGAHAIPKPATAIGQTLIGFYGGFFAAGMGMLMMALYELSGIKSVNHMNGLKTFVGLGINGISALTFLVIGSIDWHVAIVLMTGALLGGYGGAILSKKVPDHILRGVIIFYGVVMTVYFFYHY
ncbi:MAG: sulfite exporter TauE/SafE family protein [Alphaproteobacteria bacterium]|nr:sulfite exporter TauE/SafE family protein [Alphaproteobacteria bacterium]